MTDIQTHSTADIFKAWKRSASAENDNLRKHQLLKENTEIDAGQEMALNFVVFTFFDVFPTSPKYTMNIYTLYSWHKKAISIGFNTPIQRRVRNGQTQPLG